MLLTSYISSFLESLIVNQKRLYVCQRLMTLSSHMMCHCTFGNVSSNFFHLTCKDFILFSFAHPKDQVAEMFPVKMLLTLAHRIQAIFYLLVFTLMLVEVHRETFWNVTASNSVIGDNFHLIPPAGWLSTRKDIRLLVHMSVYHD